MKLMLPIICVLLLVFTVRSDEINRDDYVIPETKETESHTFQAEINRLMSIIINSLYSNSEIFLRELVSNAADALDKAKYLSLTQEGYSDIPLEIRLYSDEENGVLYITDTGVGMTKDELIRNLGSIAKSGTKEFLEKVQGSGDFNQIGQFGVGFYSSFLVADTVTVISKSHDDDQYIWESTAQSETSFTVSKDPRGNTLTRGTQVILTVNDESKQYLKVDKLKELVRRYNEFIHYPIYIWTSKEETKEVPIEDDHEGDEHVHDDENDELKIDDVVDEDDSPKTQTITETVTEWERLNNAEPLWRRPSKDITDEEYTSFYKNVLGESSDPLHYIHFKGEGDYEFTGLLYVPRSTPWGLYEPNYEPSLKLYVKRVFITDNFEEFMPRYLSFMKGLIDSDDLDLNVSREMLQQSKALKAIKKRIVRKAIGMFQDLANNEPEKYKDFHREYHQSIKLGIIDDTTNRDRLTQLLRFTSAKSTEEISLDQYVENMKKKQDKIYYLIGESKETLLNSPLLERLLKKGYDVLLMTNPIDSYVMNVLRKYQGKHEFANAGKEGVDLGDNLAELEEQYSPLIQYLQIQLAGSISKVQLSSRLTSTPAAIVSSTYGYSADMEKIMKAQALSDPRYASLLAGKKIFEINPRHPIIKKLNWLVEEEEMTDQTKELVGVLYDTALLSSIRSK